MGTPMTYISGNTGAYQSGTFNKGTIALNLNPSSLASGNNWYNGVDVTATQYLIYSDTYSTGIASQANSKPTAWTTPDLSDTSLLNLINTLPDRIGLTPFTSLPLALQWLNATNEYFLIKTNFENIVTSGLVLNLDAGWYNSYSGTTTWFDIKGGYNGTLINGPTFNGGSQGAIVFDGTDDYVNLGSIAQIAPGTGDFTIEFWINPTNWSNTYMPLLTTTVTNGIWIGKVENNFALRTYNVADDLQSTTFPTPGVWTNVIIQRSGNIATIYYNTISIVSGTVTRNYAQGTTEIARDGVTSVFNGKISTVKYYNRALSPQEILQNYNAQKSRFGIYDIVQSGLTLNLDTSNYLSYPRSGTTWFDMTSNATNGTLINGPVFNTGSTIPYIQFDGSNDYVNCGNSSLYNMSGGKSFTIIAWANFQNYGAPHQAIVTRSSNYNQYGYTLGLSSTGNLQWLVSANGINYAEVIGEKVEKNNWYYYAVGFDYGAQQIFGYTNGGKRFSSSQTGIINQTLPLEIARHLDPPTYSNVRIGDIQIYNRALLPQEIVQNFESVRNFYGTSGYTTSGLTLNLDAGNYASYPTTGTKWVDISGNYNNGTLTNGPVWSNTSGGTFTFDGTDDYIVTQSTTFTANNDFTYEIMVKSGQYIEARGIFSNKGYWEAGGQGAAIGNISSPQTIYGYVRTNTGHFDINSEVGPTYGWTHVIMRRSSNDLRFFINGVHQGSTRTISGTVTDVSDKFWLGSYNGGTTPWLGNMSVARVYNRALSQAEITQNYNALKGRFGL